MATESDQAEVQSGVPAVFEKALEGSPDRIRAGIVKVLLSLLDLRRAYFGAHCRRVAEWCREMGQLGGLSQAEQEELRVAALLHDIGFIVAPAAQLRAGPFPGGGENRSTHDLVGYSILNEIPGFERIAKAVLHHHEHYDGTGRPMRLKGDAIPLMARTIAVADAYDVEMHPGSGVPALDEDGVRRSLMNQREHRLDPDLVNRFFFVIANLDPIRRKGEQEFGITPTALTPGMVLSRDLRTLDNVLLLKSGTVLTHDQINRLLSSDKIDWLVAEAYVEARSIKEEELPPEERSPGLSAGRAGVFGSPEPAGQVRASVLTLDDSMAVCNAIRRELGREGIEVISATDVKSAVNLLDYRNFDAVITDLMMMGADGFSFLREVKARHPELHVVVLSGFPSAGNIHALKEFQTVVRFVAKPWSKQILLSSVDEAISMTRSTPRRKPGSH